MEHKMWGVAGTGNRWWPDQPESSARGAATRPEANEPMSVEHPIVPEKARQRRARQSLQYQFTLRNDGFSAMGAESRIVITLVHTYTAQFVILSRSATWGSAPETHGNRLQKKKKFLKKTRDIKRPESATRHVTYVTDSLSYLSCDPSTRLIPSNQTQRCLRILLPHRLLLPLTS